MLIRVLMIVNERSLEDRLERILEPLDAALAAAPARAVLADRIRAFPADLVVISRAALAEPLEETVETILALPERPEVIVIDDHEAAEERARLLIAGCAAVLNARLSDETLREAFNVFVLRKRASSVARLQYQLDVDNPSFEDFTSHNASMKSFLRIARRASGSDTSILLQGETGVGKEHLARAIHAASPRAAGPFIALTPAAYPEALLESELFGHDRGAFTGAVGQRRGCFELAHGGTILLDEIGDMPRHLQVKLLRVLQERAIRRIGSDKLIDVDVRVIAATHRNLETATKAGRFREDLYYRLAVVTLEVPPLRSRREDIPELLERYLTVFRRRLKANASAFSPEARACLVAHAWPGNVRELINVVERAVLLGDGDTVACADLPTAIARRSRPEQPSRALDVLGVDGWSKMEWKEVRDAALRACERGYFVELLERNGGNVKQTAKTAGINPKSLYDLMKRHGLEKADYKGVVSPPPRTDAVA